MFSPQNSSNTLFRFLKITSPRKSCIPLQCTAHSQCMCAAVSCFTLTPVACLTTIGFVKRDVSCSTTNNICDWYLANLHTHTQLGAPRSEAITQPVRRMIETFMLPISGICYADSRRLSLHVTHLEPCCSCFVGGCRLQEWLLVNRCYS